MISQTQKPTVSPTPVSTSGFTQFTYRRFIRYHNPVLAYAHQKEVVSITVESKTICIHLKVHRVELVGPQQSFREGLPLQNKRRKRKKEQKRLFHNTWFNRQ
jgi:hypothetical protein